MHSRVSLVSLLVITWKWNWCDYIFLRIIILLIFSDYAGETPEPPEDDPEAGEEEEEGEDLDEDEIDSDDDY